jgi:methionyl-tRNA formyltransferase
MSSDKITIVFAGTPEFAQPSLENLATDTRFEILGVITQPDRPAGRGQKLAPSAIKQTAYKLGLPVWQPTRIKDLAADLKKLAPDFLVVVAYGQILPLEILEIPKQGAINLHGSLLPKYRGAACVAAPILNGDPVSGVTIMLMDVGLDSGPILDQKTINLDSRETAATLHDKLSQLGASRLGDVLADFYTGKITPKNQPLVGISYFPTLNKEAGLIDWCKEALLLDREVRAYYPWPGSFTTWSGRRLKIIRAEVWEGENLTGANPGKVLMVDKKLLVSCGQGFLNILELQLEGSRSLTAVDFLSGHGQIIGSRLGL